MKKYRLKEEIRRLFKSNSPMLEAIMPVKDWQIKYGIFSCDLEEVKDRIELRYHENSGEIYKNIVCSDNDIDIELCEKALNGELFTKEDMEAFVNYSRRVDNIKSPTNVLIKEFLRMKNNDY